VTRREFEIDSPEAPGLDAREVVLGFREEGLAEHHVCEKAPRAVLWQGSLLGDSTPQRSYFVVVYDDGSGRCSCPDYYFRAVNKDVPDYTCKHIRKARAQIA